MADDAVNDLVSVAEAAKACAVDAESVHRWIRHGTVKAYKVGRNRRVRLADLIRHVPAAAGYALPAPKPPKRHPLEPVEACVYFVESHGLIKIGTTGDLTNRLQGLSAFSAVAIRLLGYIGIPFDQARAREALIHAEFASKRQHGEWFDLTEQAVVDYIAKHRGVIAHTGSYS